MVSPVATQRRRAMPFATTKTPRRPPRSKTALSGTVIRAAAEGSCRSSRANRPERRPAVRGRSACSSKRCVDGSPAGEIDRRSVHNRSRPSASADRPTSIAPCRRQIRSIRSISADTDSFGPSTSIRRAHPASSGTGRAACSRTQSIAVRSINSRAQGVMRSPMIATTALEPSWLDRKNARTVETASGRGTSRRIALVTIPSVPSDPTSSLVRSYPTTPLTV